MRVWRVYSSDTSNQQAIEHLSTKLAFSQDEKSFRSSLLLLLDTNPSQPAHFISLSLPTGCGTLRPIVLRRSGLFIRPLLSICEQMESSVFNKGEEGCHSVMFAIVFITVNGVWVGDEKSEAWINWIVSSRHPAARAGLRPEASIRTSDHTLFCSEMVRCRINKGCDMGLIVSANHQGGCRVVQR